MATADHPDALTAEIVNEFLGVLRLQALVPVIVDQDDRRPVARAKALDLEQRERAAWIGLAGPDSSLRDSTSVTRSAPFKAHDSVRHTCSTYFPTGCA
jgi:hypothetical protein